ncbi:MAG: hypothetical protein KDE27_22660 [Planctomycetes bacterium]|nr:hypothetical protein [Planctomycetota bacterium]
MRLLVMRRGGLGDTLLMLPLLRCLRRAEPDAEITFAGVPEFAAPLLAHGVVDRVASVEDLALWQPGRARERLQPFDRVIGDVPDFADVPLAPQALVPGIPAGRQLAQQAGFEPIWPDDSWLLPPRRSPTADPPAGAVWLAPGSGGRRKCLPPAHWLALARSLSPAAVEIVVVVGPAEVERDDPRRWPWPDRTSFFADRSVAELAAELAEAALYCGHDSGTSHLAAALGVPTRLFFTVTDPAVWAPVGPHVEVVTATG